MPTDINPYSSPLDRIWEIEFAGSEGDTASVSEIADNTVVAMVDTKQKEWAIAKSKNTTEDGQ